MKGTAPIVSLLLFWEPVSGQQSNALPGAAKLFDGFSEMISGSCKAQSDGCLNFFEGWYMHNGTAGTSDCQTTCIRFPSVHSELTCGTCESVVDTPVLSLVEKERSPLFFDNVVAPPTVAISATLVPLTSTPSSKSPTKSPITMTPRVAPVIIQSPVLTYPTKESVTLEGPVSFPEIFQTLPMIVMSSLPSDTASNIPSNMVSNIPSNMVSNIPSNMVSSVPSDIGSALPSVLN